MSTTPAAIDGPRSFFVAAVRYAQIGIAVFILAGCGPAAAPTPADIANSRTASEHPRAPEAGKSDAGGRVGERTKSAGNTVADKDTSFQKVRETWDAYFLQGHHVGYSHTTIYHGRESGRNIVRVENASRLSLQRGGDASESEMRSVSVETPSGELIRFESETRMGPGAIRMTGRVRGKQLDVEVQSPHASEPERKTIPWSPDIGGPLAAEQSLLRQPLEPGNRRALKMLDANSGEAIEVEMAAKAWESVKLGDKTRRLLRIETVTRFSPTQTIESTTWCDATGDVLKTCSQNMGLEIVRATKAEATKMSGEATVDLLPSMVVRVDRALTRPHQTKKIRYRVRLDHDNPAEVFAAGPTQAVRSIDAHTAEITVYAVRPGVAGNLKAPAEKYTDDDLRPNRFIQSDDPVVAADAKKAVDGESDPWRMVLAMERFVGREVKKKNFSQALATAAEVARSREGDCTEHGVFLAALARARNIPARIAVGLVYMDGCQMFGYHLWTEVYVGGQWIPIDGTLGLGGIGAAHLKVAHSNFQGSSIYDAFAPVARLIGQLHIEILDAK